MSLTSLDAIEAAIQYPIYYAKVGALTSGGGNFNSQFYQAGFPDSAIAPSAGLAGEALTSLFGQIPFTNPVAGNTYLAGLRFTYQNTVGTNVFNWGAVLLCDRLWQNSGIDVTSAVAQTINSVAWPARDANGATAGDSIYIGVEVTATVGAAAPTFSMSYTNSSGASGKTGIGLLTGSAGAASPGSFYPLGLASGDVGVQSIQTFTLSTSWLSGAISLVAFRVIAMADIPLANGSGNIDAITGGFPRLYDNSVPMLLGLNGRGTTNYLGATILFAQG